MVALNVYDLTKSPLMEALNQVSLTLVGGGAFHVGIEVWGHEWFYGFKQNGSGVTSVMPCKDGAHHFRGSVQLGCTSCSKAEVEELIQQLASAAEWQGTCYHDIMHNCCHFARALAAHVGVGPLPGWVDRLGRTAEGLLAPVDKDSLANFKALNVPWKLSCQPASAFEQCCRKIPCTVMSM